MIYLVLILFILAIILISLLKIEIQSKDIIRDEISVNIYFLHGLIKFKYNFKITDINSNAVKITTIYTSKNKERKEKKKYTIEELTNMYQKINRIKDTLNYIKKYVQDKIIIKKIHWHTNLALSNPAYTAIAFGIFSSIKHWIIAYITFKDYIVDTSLDIVPIFNTQDTKSCFHCIIQIKLVHIIIIMFMVLKAKLKGGEVNVKSSY